MFLCRYKKAIESALLFLGQFYLKGKAIESRKRVVEIENLAYQVAEGHRIYLSPGSSPSLIDWLKEQSRLLSEIHLIFSQRRDEDPAISYASEWLLDNFYIVQQTITQIKEDLPDKYYRQLPKLTGGPLNDYPRIYDIARELIKNADALLDFPQLIEFVRAYQQITPLTMGELWAFPTMLRLGILDVLIEALIVLNGQPQGENRPFPKIEMAETLREDGVVANTILSLRMLEVQNWNDFFEQVNLIDAVLAEDPAQIYKYMDFETRNRYRQIIENLASATGFSEMAVAQLAVKLAQAEAVVSGDEIHVEAHVGFYLAGNGHKVLESRLGFRPPPGQRLQREIWEAPVFFYLGSIGALSIFIMIPLLIYVMGWGTTWLQLMAMGVLILGPVMAVAIDWVNFFITHVIPPRVLPKMDFEKGIASDCRTMVVIPSLLVGIAEIDPLLRQLELHFLNNPDPWLSFALLTDFADSLQPELPDDNILLARVSSGIEALNRKYRRDSNSPFYLFHRRRSWNSMEGVWMGWERKRGKLTEFNQLLQGDPSTSFQVKLGELEVLSQIRYVITLDADSVLPWDAAKKLVATLAHPLNWPRFDDVTGKVTAGYTVLQPRVELKPVSARRSVFSRIFSGDTGLDLYTRAVSNVYQDLLGEGIFVGKGIYDVKAFDRSLAGRVPENALLSHDLFEGILGRAGLVTDVVVYEEYPSHYLAHAQRIHRWVRGDWQLLPWLGRRVRTADGGKIPSQLSLIDRWKIFDNLRRSLLIPWLLLIFVLGWTAVLPGPPWIWSWIGLLPLGGTFVVTCFEGLWRSFTRPSRQVLPPLWSGLGRWVMALIFLPFESLLLLDAIVRTLVRILVTHRSLLEWVPAAYAGQQLETAEQNRLVWRRMGYASAFALGVGLLLFSFRPAGLGVAAPLLLIWLFSPQIAFWISLPLIQKSPPLAASQLPILRRLARRTWLYFEHFVGPDDHWLPPDHFQETPLGVTTHLTSPTNMGMGMLASLAAYDLGYVGLLGLTLRLRAIFDTLEQLERHRGHFLNWYDTRTLVAVGSQYVSTVDSGNLAASFLIFRRGVMELTKAPIWRWAYWQGILDTVEVLIELLSPLTSGSQPLLAYLERLQRYLWSGQDDETIWGKLLQDLNSEMVRTELDRLLIVWVESSSELEPELLRSLRIWFERFRHQVEVVIQELNFLVPWLFLLDEAPVGLKEAEAGSVLGEAWKKIQAVLSSSVTVEQLPDVCRRGEALLMGLQAELSISSGDPDERLRLWISQLHAALQTSRLNASGLYIACQDLAERAEQYFREMDFSFLLDPQRLVFHLGYNVESGRLDANYYDLLASEARIASLVAIAKGDVPQIHWLHLSRPVALMDHGRGLISWSGTMFEYLMPLLFMKDDPDTLLGQSVRAAVDVQIHYGRRKATPWGVSESAYYHFDAALNYQYKAFGVPGLGFKRGLGEELVIAPYASLLALSLRPQAVWKNIVALLKVGLLGDYGFYEAIDYTPARMGLGQGSGLVKTYMVHHQGMILLSLTNYLLDQVMVQRFHADLRIQSVELLLYEQVAAVLSAGPLDATAIAPARPEKPQTIYGAWNIPLTSQIMQSHLLSNGRYTVFLTQSGSGYSAWNAFALTWWRADSVLDDYGTWIYVQEQGGDNLWSVSFQPTAAWVENQNVYFSPHQVEYRCRHRDISFQTLITVSPYEDVEIRVVMLTNHTDRKRQLRLTSYGEVALARFEDVQRHPVFNKLFIESEYLPEINGLLFRRRPRSVDDPTFYFVHMVVPESGVSVTGAYESDRERFLGRGRTSRRPQILDLDSSWLSGTAGATLDPVMALGQEIALPPHAFSRVAFVTLVARSRKEALALAERYRAWAVLDRVVEQTSSAAELELYQLGMDTQNLEMIQQLLSLLIFPRFQLRASMDVRSANRLGQSGLWPFGISGDYPILLVKIASKKGSRVLRELLRAHNYWRNRQLKIDLVIYNEGDTGYNQDLQGYLRRLIAHSEGEAWINRRGGIFLIQVAALSESDRILLQSVAYVVLDGEQGELREQLASLQGQILSLPHFIPTLVDLTEREPTPILERDSDLQFDNGFGGFSAEGREYIIYRNSDQPLPAPWINVIANSDFGFLVSDAGLGPTWAINSGENRLTPWLNDPVTDFPVEVIYLRDEETGRVWSPTPAPVREPLPYRIRHGAGYSVFEHNSHGLSQHLTVFALMDAPVKVIHVRLENHWMRIRRITATCYLPWVLGTTPEATRQMLIPAFDAGRRLLTVANPYHPELSERVAFLAASEPIHGVTTDRIEFVGVSGDLAQPAGLLRIGLSGTVTATSDPCAVLQIHINLAPGESREFYFLLGEAENLTAVHQVLKRLPDPSAVAAARQAVDVFWDRLLGTVTVKTPDRAMDFLLNRWLLYQTLVCRVWGRSAFYQSSGAFGYRDQLQDVGALLHARPDLIREHILRAAAHQFEAGDVLHWWHPPSGRGVRTRFSDDLLWLPWVTALYVKTTGDHGILDELIPFRKGDLLSPGVSERYDLYPFTEEKASLYEHCRRAVERGFTTGPHGLPLIGSGDWNDGLNRVGIGGQGESVWLAWFLFATLNGFADLCEVREELQAAALYRTRAQNLYTMIENVAWDGQWYLRAFYDDGTPLGSAENLECQIDAIAQSWAILSGAAKETSHSRQAMAAVMKWLVSWEDALILLFTPPFDHTLQDPGYIKGYLPGVRENGGQYTHAAIWTAWAMAGLGEGNLAESLFHLLNPIYHAERLEQALHYRVEPYVIAADIYSVPPHRGRGGWTWYTGSSGWMYRLGLEAILGLRRQGDRLFFDPCIPADWAGYEILYRAGETTYRIVVTNPHHVQRGVKWICLDGQMVADGEIILSGDGQRHEVEVVMGEDKP